MTDSKRTQAEGFPKKGTRTKKVTAHLLMSGLVLSSLALPLTSVLAQETNETTTNNQANQEAEQTVTEKEIPVAPETPELEPETPVAVEPQVPEIAENETETPTKSEKTYHLGSDGFWYDDEIEEHIGINNYVDIDFTFTDKETGEVLATLKEDKYYFDVESGFFVDLTTIGVDTTNYGLLLDSQDVIKNLHNPILVNSQPTEYYSLFSFKKAELFNDGAGTMKLVIPLDRLSDTTPPTIDEENRPVLKETITEAKTYLDKDKYQAKYVDALDTAIKSGEQALADNPQVQARTLVDNTSTNEKVFQEHIDAINSALADVKANPLSNPVDPVDPANPVDPTNPVDQVKPGTTNVSTKPNKEVVSKDNSTNTLPQTGESNNPLINSLGFGSIAIATLAWFFKRKRT